MTVKTASPEESDAFARLDLWVEQCADATGFRDREAKCRELKQAIADEVGLGRIDRGVAAVYERQHDSLAAGVTAVYTLKELIRAAIEEIGAPVEAGRLVGERASQVADHLMEILTLFPRDPELRAYEREVVERLQEWATSGVHQAPSAAVVRDRIQVVEAHVLLETASGVEDRGARRSADLMARLVDRWWESVSELTSDVARDYPEARRQVDEALATVEAFRQSSEADTARTSRLDALRKRIVQAPQEWVLHRARRLLDRSGRVEDVPGEALHRLDGMSQMVEYAQELLPSRPARDRFKKRVLAVLRDSVDRHLQSAEFVALGEVSPAEARRHAQAVRRLLDGPVAEALIEPLEIARDAEEWVAVTALPDEAEQELRRREEAEARLGARAPRLVREADAADSDEAGAAVAVVASRGPGPAGRVFPRVPAVGFGVAGALVVGIFLTGIVGNVMRGGPISVPVTAPRATVVPGREPPRATGAPAVPATPVPAPTATPADATATPADATTTPAGSAVVAVAPTAPAGPVPPPAFAHRPARSLLGVPGYDCVYVGHHNVCNEGAARFKDVYAGALKEWLGLPVTERVRNDEGRVVQYFQRGVLEHHPENARVRPQQEYQLGLLGLALAQKQARDTSSVDGRALAQAMQRTAEDRSRGEYYLLYGKHLNNRYGFQDYYDQHGGSEAFGYPVSEAFQLADGSVVQYFERAVFLARPGVTDVTLMNVGLEYLQVVKGDPVCHELLGNLAQCPVP